MVFHIKKSTLFFVLRAFVYVIFCLAFIYAIFLTTKKNITYHPVAKNSLYGESTISHTSTPFASDISEIEEDGPFIIQYDNDGIYVFYENKKVYRIKADISYLPASDKIAISHGLAADTKQRLIELIQYMES